jgi:hypothetical protein
MIYEVTKDELNYRLSGKSMPTKYIIRALSNCLLVFCLAVIPVAAFAEDKADVDFFNIVKKNFHQWDRKNGGTLTPEDIDLDLQDARIKGDDAAALAALKLGERAIERRTKQTITFTPAIIAQLEQEAASGKKSFPDYVYYFDWSRKKIASVDRHLFAKGKPHLAAIRQDKTSDCYWLSAVGALAYANPQAIVDMIAANADGSYTVTLPKRDPLHVITPTDAEIAVYSDAGDDGIWLNVLEKACAQTNFTHREAVEPMDVVAGGGGYSGQAIHLLTGHQVYAIRFHGPQQKLSPADLKYQVLAYLSLAFQKHKIVTTGKMNHIYAVVAYDAQHEIVTIWNPQGRSGREKWSDGKKGPKMEDGFFTVSVDDLIRNFLGILIER